MENSIIMKKSKFVSRLTQDDRENEIIGSVFINFIFLFHSFHAKCPQLLYFARLYHSNYLHTVTVSQCSIEICLK